MGTGTPREVSVAHMSPDLFDAATAVAEPPASPKRVNVRYSIVDPTSGRMKPVLIQVEGLPDECTGNDLLVLLGEKRGISPRQPMALQCWGKTLDPACTLRQYAVKEHSEITLVFKSRPPIGAPVLSDTEPLSCVRVKSHKLQQCVAIDGITAEMTVAELKQRIGAYFAKNTTYIAKQTCQSGELLIAKGDTLLLDGSKGKGALKVRKANGDESGTVVETDIAELDLRGGLPAENPPTLVCQGRQMEEEKTLAHYDMANHECVSIDFRWPWFTKEDEEKKLEAEAKAREKAAKGKGKKKK